MDRVVAFAEVPQRSPTDLTAAGRGMLDLFSWQVIRKRVCFGRFTLRDRRIDLHGCCRRRSQRFDQQMKLLDRPSGIQCVNPAFGRGTILLPSQKNVSAELGRTRRCGILYSPYPYGQLPRRRLHQTVSG